MFQSLSRLPAVESARTVHTLLTLAIPGKRHNVVIITVMPAKAVMEVMVNMTVMKVMES